MTELSGTMQRPSRTDGGSVFNLQPSTSNPRSPTPSGLSFGPLLQRAQSLRGSLGLTLKPPTDVIRALAGRVPDTRVSGLPLPVPSPYFQSPGAAPESQLGAWKPGFGNGVTRDALSQIGKPYVFGANDFGRDPAAFDCSSFTKWLFQRQDVVLPRTAQQQYQAAQRLSAAEARPGDLVFFRDTYPTPSMVTHVGVYLGDNRVVSAAGAGVSVQSLGDPYWSSRLVGFGRPVGAAPRVDGPQALASMRPMSLQDFPRPEQDNGRGMHWIPTTSSPPEVVDRFVAEAAAMNARWMVFLNDNANIGANDYLVKQLVAHEIMPIMRVYTPRGEPIRGNLEAMVQHYRELGVPYFQLFNEPNLNVENPDGRPNVERYVRMWLDAAQRVVSAGGLPGFGALSPGGDYDDRPFFRRALELLKDQADPSVMGRTWVALHNYTFNQPLEHDSDSYGFMAFKVYDQMVRDSLGRQLPIIGTEGGAVLGEQLNRERPPVTEASQAQKMADIYRYMQDQREPYNFAYTTWVIANHAGGGADPGFERHALFLADRHRPVVDALRRLA